MPRPPDGPERGEQLRADVLAEAAILWRQHYQRPPTLRLVAGRLGYSEDGLGKALRRHGLTWQALRAAAWAEARRIRADRPAA